MRFKRIVNETKARVVALLSLCALLLPAGAQAQVLTFEGVGHNAAVNDFYNGGTDSAGNSGPNLGINFSSQSLGLIDLDAGGAGTGNFANEPSPSTVLFFLSGGAATMNVAAGFMTGFSFFYSASELGFVNVYSGLNATGILLAAIPLAINFNIGCTGDPNGQYCNWDPIGVPFVGTARSVDFGGSANFIAFDDVTLSSVTPGAPIPEPSTYGLMLAGLGLVAFVASRRRRAQPCAA